MWSELPDLLLEKIFSHLNYEQRYYCSQMCRLWYDVFYSPRLWRRLVVHDKTFTYRRFNLYKGYERQISHERVQMYLNRVGWFLRSLVIHPNSDFYNLYEFLNVFSSFLEFFDEYPMPEFHKLHFTFACESRFGDQTIIHGTGGQVLGEVKRLLGNLRDVTNLTLNHLLLDSQDAIGLLDSVVENSRDSLTYLEILNCSKYRHPLFHVGMLPKLKKLVISPLQLTDDIVIMLAKSSVLDELVIVQDRYSNPAEPVSSRAWWEMKMKRHRLRVRLEVRGITETDIVVQEKAPVSDIIYDTPYSRVSAETVLSVVDHYSRTLRVYGHKGLPRRHGSRSFHDRADSHLIMLVRECPSIQTLIIRERISSCTLLIIASEAKNLCNLHVRQNAILKKFDWPRADHWTDEFYQWLKVNSLDLDAMEKEISQILECPWKMLSDKAFKTLKC